VVSTPVQAAPAPGPDDSAPTFEDEDTAGPDESPLLTAIITRVDRDPEALREVSGGLHVSTVISDCGRMVQLARRSPNPIYRPAPTGGHRVMWLIGRAVEAHIRSTYITAVQGVGVRGRWLCRCGHIEIEQTGWPDVLCPRCDQPPRTYGEITLRDPNSSLSGRPDMIVVEDDPGGAFDTIVEIKSMNGPDFDALNRPEGGHVEQAATYRRLNELNGRRTNARVRVIYCTKVFVYGNPYREFAVDVGPGTVWHDSVDEYLNTARLIMRDELLPRRAACSDPHRPAARSCPTCADCFLRS
jgi:hypothetical protein